MPYGFAFAVVADFRRGFGLGRLMAGFTSSSSLSSLNLHYSVVL